MTEALGLLETVGLTPALVAIDAMEKAANIEVLNVELNDFYGVCVKIVGRVADVSTAIEAGRRAAEAMGGQPVSDVIPGVDRRALPVIAGRREFNPLIQQEVVFFPSRPAVTSLGPGERRRVEDSPHPRHGEA
jgi:microcompartment protein CcmL/EutN